MVKDSLKLLIYLIGIFCCLALKAQTSKFDSVILQLEKSGYEDKQAGSTNLTRVFYLKLGADFDKTLVWVNSNINEFSKRGNKKALAWNIAFLGVIQEHLGQSQVALKNLRSSLTTAEKLKIPELQGFIQMNLGNFFSHTGQYDSASYYFIQADQHLRNLSSYFQFLSSFNRIVFFSESNQPDSASLEFNKIQKLAYHPDLKFYKIHFQYLSVLARMTKGNFALVSDEIDQILKESIPNSIIQLLAFQTKTTISYRSGGFPNMVKDYSPILNNFKILNKLGLYNRAKLFLSLAEGYDSQGQYDLAFQYVNRAMKLAGQGGYQVLIGKCHLEVAWLNFALDDFTGAERELKFADSIFQKFNERFSQTDALNLLAQIRKGQGRMAESTKLHEECLLQRLALNDSYLISSSLYNIGRNKSAAGQYNEALNYFRKGIKIDFAKGDYYGVSQYQFEIAIAFRALARRDSSIWYLKKAVELSRSTGVIEVEKPGYLMLSEIYEEIGDRKLGMDYLRKYIKVQDELLDRESKMNLEAYKTLVKLNSKETELEQINKIRSQQEDLVKAQQTLLYFMISGIIIAIIFAVVFFRISKKMRQLSELNLERANLLDHQKSELEVALSNLNKAQDQLMMAEKMATLGVMSSGVAHELNNPLNFIKGGFMALRSELSQNSPNAEKVDKFLGIIDEGVQRSTRIIQSLSHYSHSSDNLNENCDVHLILDNCLLMVENKLRGRIEIEKQFLSEKIILKGNSGKFHQALLNLISNAEQAIEDRGKIILSTKLTAGTTLISIEDTGCGISEQNIKRLGDLFFTTKEPGKGTGFGLSLCYRVIGEMGGKIEVESVLGRGTKFTLKFFKKD